MDDQTTKPSENTNELMSGETTGPDENGDTVVVYPDGSMQVTDKDGNVTHIDKDGNIAFNAADGGGLTMDDDTIEATNAEGEVIFSDDNPDKKTS